MVEFAMVDFEEPDTSFGEEAVQRTHIEKIKSRCLPMHAFSQCVLESVISM